MPRFDRALTVLMGLLFLFFALPKLTAADVSVSLFEQINRFMGWSGAWFRIVTGVLELVVGALLVGGGLATRAQGPLLSAYGVFLLGALGTVGTMLGALFVELAIRPGEDLILTVLATVLLGLALLLIWRNRQHLPVLGSPVWR